MTNIYDSFKIILRYYLQFEARRGLRARGDIAIDDVSMSPECFGLNVPEKEKEGYDYDNFSGFIGKTFSFWNLYYQSNYILLAIVFVLFFQNQLNLWKNIATSLTKLVGSTFAYFFVLFVYNREKLSFHLNFSYCLAYLFTSCGARGRVGPTPENCTAAYNNTSTNVTVLQDATLNGVQRWVVPKDGYYT